MAFENCTGNIKVSINVIAFVVLKILRNLASVWKFCSQVTANVSKITKNLLRDLTCTFNKLSENVNSFV